MISRYTRPEMAKIWSDQSRLRAWFEVEILAAEALSRRGRVPRGVAARIRKKYRLNVDRIAEIEKTVKHDVIAFLTQVEESVGPDARHLHVGLTSSDVLDTALSVQIKKASDLIEADLNQFIATLKSLARKHKMHVMVGRSHGIHAEPITFGLKVAGWLSEAVRNKARFQDARRQVEVGKLSGAVGTFAHNDPDVESAVCKKLGLTPEPVATQVVPRDRHAAYFSSLALIGGMLERIAVEIRHLQRTEVLEVEEAFTKGQKGSSAMPHKRNPVGAENITGLSRLIRGNMAVSFENVPLWHERDISHSSVERVIFPDTTILVDYALTRMTGMLKTLRVYPKNMRANLKKTEGFLGTQKVLLALVNKGMDRQKAYETVQKNALRAWNAGKNVRTLIERDAAVKDKLSKKELAACFDLSSHLRHVNTLFKRAGL